MAAVLALLSSLLWGTADFVGGLLSRDRPAVLVVALSQAAGLISITVVAVAAGAFGDPTGYVGWAVLAGLAGLVGLVSFYAALASGTMGVVSPIAALGVVLPVVAGLVKGERPSAVQVAGIVVAIAGVVLASGPELRGAAGGRPVLLAAVAAVAFGLTLLALAEGSQSSTLMTLVTMRATSVVVLGSVVGVMAERAARRGGGRVWRVDLRLAAVASVAGLGDVGANLTFGLASTRGLVSLVAVLGSLYPVFTVLLALVVLHERLGRVQQVGVLGALAGVALIAAG